MNRTCSVDGCNLPHRAKGLCSRHYQRLRLCGEVGPVGLVNDNPPYVEHFERVMLVETDDCVIWPYGRISSGYGEIRIPGLKGQKLVHILACERAHGPRPTPKHDAAHCRPDGTACESKACFNPRHLRWATRKENMDDRVLHGTSNRGSKHHNAKLTVEDVRAIRATRAAGEAPEHVAARYGLARTTIDAIVSRRTWAWLD